MKSQLLTVNAVEKRFAGVFALVNFSCRLHYGEILGLIGPNGAGKTTLFDILCGFTHLDSGTIHFRGEDIASMPAHQRANIGISRTFQNVRLVRKISVLDNLLLSYKEQYGEHLGSVFFRPAANLAQEAANRKEALFLLERLGLADHAAYPAGCLSYGQQKLLSLACCEAQKPQLSLLDEPVAGIGPEMIDRTRDTILSFRSPSKSAVIIEHNIEALTEVCDRVIFLDAGTKVAEGTPLEVCTDSKVIEAYIR